MSFLKTDNIVMSMCGLLLLVGAIAFAVAMNVLFTVDILISML